MSKSENGKLGGIRRAEVLSGEERAAIASKGGKKLRRKYGKKHFQEMGRKSALARAIRKQTQTPEETESRSKAAKKAVGSRVWRPVKKRRKK